MKFYTINFGETKEYFISFMTDISIDKFNSDIKPNIKKLLYTEIDNENIENMIVDMFHKKGYKCAIMNNVEFIQL